MNLEINFSKKDPSNKLLKRLKIFFGFIVVVITVSSCIPNEKVVYLQNKDEIPGLFNDSLISLTRIDYKLQPNDILLITFNSEDMSAVERFYPIFSRQNVFGSGNSNNGGNGSNGVGQDAYMTGYNIDSKGFLAVNGLTKSKAAGLTMLELEELIEKKVAEEGGVKDIKVSVKMEGIPYTMLGEIGEIGPELIRKYEANVLEAIANSGDLTINADRLHVKIMRQYPEGVRIHEVDVTGRSFIQSEFFYLRPHDIIYVPPLKIREIGTGANALENLAVIVSVISSTALIISILNNN